VVSLFPNGNNDVSATKKRRKRQSAKSGSFTLKARLWIEGEDGTFVGFGRVVLLDRIRRHGSISKAAKSMNISYRRAWELVDSMNSQSNEPVVTTAIGGKGGGGAHVTDSGLYVIGQFWDLYKKLNRFLEKENVKLKL
jgi:molybdate transport system regulatory protein